MSISLPVATESVRCVDFAIANHIDPGGTALAPDVVVLVEAGEPWPKPAGKHEALVDLVRFCQDWTEQIRLLAAVPKDGQPHRAIAFRPTPTGMTRAEHPLGSDPVGALRSVLEAEEADTAEVSNTADGVTSLLVCTQGSHDICCGEDGARFADWAEANAETEVFRVSHTGGHRFAPTAMTLPDGRMWAYLDESSATQILSLRNDARSVVGQCRGWWGAPTGPAQVGERAVFAELGFEADHLERTVSVHDGEVDGAYDVVVQAGDARYLATIEVGREVPTISCSVPGGEPVKPGREWRVTSGPSKQ